MSASKHGFWWCPECKKEVPPIEVTFDEHHETCGQRVTAKTIMPANKHGWRPVESAPKDGTVFLASRHQRIYFAHWSVRCRKWAIYRFNFIDITEELDAWQPLPEPLPEGTKP